MAAMKGAGLLAASAVLLVGVGRVLGPSPTAFDRALLTGMRAADPNGRLLELARDVTACGSGPVLTILVAIVAGWLLIRRRVRSALLLAIGSESAGQAVDLAKAFVARPRPELVPHWIAVGNYSYPSAHSADSAVVATLLALLIARARPEHAARVYVAAVAMFATAAIGCSRVYLAVHWPSDVLAGWSFGFAWALNWWWMLGPSGARE